MYLEYYRRRINALKHKLAVVRLRPLAEEYCGEWEAAVAEGNEPPPASPVELLKSKTASAGPPKKATRSEPFFQPFSQRVSLAGFRSMAFMALHNYLERCREGRNYPQPNEIRRSLLPKAAVWGLIPKSPAPVSYRHARVGVEPSPQKVPSPSRGGLG